VQVFTKYAYCIKKSDQTFIDWNNTTKKTNIRKRSGIYKGDTISKCYINMQKNIIGCS